MSTVYLGEQTSLGREVAIKVMLPAALADEVSRRRFENEARTIARLEHPHIVSIFEVGRTLDGLPYYAMPHLARGHLGQRDMTQDSVRVRATLRALLSALDYAHARGVIHRDVKAENVLFDEAERPLLADFGIALRRGFGPRVTTAGLAVGSTAYMAPEQARGEEVDYRADLYSVGVLAWEMLTGKLPFNAGDALSMAVMHAQDPVPRLPPALRHWQRFMDRALAKSPKQRFRNVQHMLETLDRVPQRDASQSATALASLRHGIGGVKRWPGTVWIGVGLLGAALAGVALRHSDDASDRFFRASPAARTSSAGNARALPAPETSTGVGLLGGEGDDPTDAMLRAAPESAAERWVTAADREMRQRKLVAPKGDNAFDSLITAWQTDPAHVRLPSMIDALVTQFGSDAERAFRAGDDAHGRASIEHGLDLAKRTGQERNPAVAAMRQRTGAALAMRVDTAVAKFDRTDALAAARLYQSLKLDPVKGAALATKATATPQTGQHVPGDAVGAILIRAGNSVLAAAPTQVSRDEYARFAKATGRTPALCRERTSLLRIVKPRTWQSPGFSQSGNQPVVCVSWSDADAYARWIGQHNGGKHYRLPSATEARALPSAHSAKAVAEWANDCSGNCNQRVVSGQSWRGVGGARALEAARGYDDVGFRLVREL
ncbi:MAG: bifunctional serine/threonine-protein kinase/formylglycine-generating enzyme family protein, partial [Luteimonas sp.]